MAETKSETGWNQPVFRSITVKQLVAMIIGILLALAILCLGFGGSVLGWLGAAILLYICPRLAKVKSKDIAIYGVVFAVIAVLIGGLLVAPSFIDSYSDETPGDHGAFSNVTYTYTDDGTYTVEFDYDLTDYEGDSIIIYVAHINQILFTYPVADSADAYIIASTEDSTLTSTTGHISYTLTDKQLSTDTLWEISLVVGTAYSDDDGDGTYTLIADSDDWDYNTDSISMATLTGFAGADKYGPSFVGCADALVYTMIMFFLIVGMVWLIRDRVNKTREKMEKEGRLYPQGYGRCDNCGALILPGEVQCRKCGAYINRPDYMKPKKVDYFQCSNCGAEVPADSKVCPKCGAKFDAIEEDIVKDDGTVETVGETKETEESKETETSTEGSKKE